MRAIALSCPPPALDMALRGTYRAVAQNAKFVSAASLPHIHFMGAAVVEMTRLDPGGGGHGVGGEWSAHTSRLCKGAAGPAV